MPSSASRAIPDVVVERAAHAILTVDRPEASGWSGKAEEVRERYRQMARAVFASLPEGDEADADDLVRWAALYGHPEEWAKKAQAAHARAEDAEAALGDLLGRLQRLPEEQRRLVLNDADSDGCPR